MRLRHFFRIVRRSEWTLRVLGLLFLFTVWLWARWAGTHYREPGVTPDGLFIDSKYLNLGEMWEQREFEWPVVVENRAPSPVQIVNWYSSCACTRIAPAQITIPAFAAAEVRLVLDLTAFVKTGITPRLSEGSGYRSQQLPGSLPRHRFSFYLRPEFHGLPNNGTQWELAGVVRQALLASPSTARFEESLVRGRRAEPVRVNLVPLSGTRIKGVRPDPQSRVDLALSEAGSGIWTLVVTPRPSLPAGPLKTGAVLDLESESDGCAWAFILPIEGTVVERVRVVPEQVYLGFLRNGEACQERLTLTCADGKAFVAEPVTPIAEGIRLERERDSDLHAYVLTVSPRGIGQQSSSVQFRVRFGNAEPFVVAARINYYGLDSGPSRSK